MLADDWNEVMLSANGMINLPIHFVCWRAAG